MHTLDDAPGTPDGLHFAGSNHEPFVAVAQCTLHGVLLVGGITTDRGTALSGTSGPTVESEMLQAIAIARIANATTCK